MVVIHSRGDDNTWAPSRALYSSHSGYHNYAWKDIHSTLATDEVQNAETKPPEGGKDKDHPMVYVAWSKHAQFDTTNKIWLGPIAQSTDNAYRSGDWWRYVDRKHYVRDSRVNSSTYLTAYRFDRITLLRRDRSWDGLIGGLRQVILPRCMIRYVLRRRLGVE